MSDDPWFPWPPAADLVHEGQISSIPGGEPVHAGNFSFIDAGSLAHTATGAVSLVTRYCFCQGCLIRVNESIPIWLKYSFPAQLTFLPGNGIHRYSR
ncbi:MAG: hypothetical protein GTO45_36425 [Candidatus Aminicenantes bacterium]|nr:hypothetical protein [Candidatus Aminicenantes bacterium]NIM81516.1 hypothetical protein [Candidatus Aminicenantes bacterium]NIN23636.1 hypothetical protein [Candidatus Aminicenantes bacterium]NIN47343.1 hypothetical protein [Candidatus Aminicenantes bacterium]NIN90272.1 hypothetical protein [Candidatus Aminicenantes bacterium]